MKLLTVEYKKNKNKNKNLPICIIVERLKVHDNVTDILLRLTI